MVCSTLANPSTQRRKPALRVSQMPVGIATAAAISMATSTSSRCSTVSDAISLRRPGSMALHIPIKTGEKGARFLTIRAQKFPGRRQRFDMARVHQPDTRSQHERFAYIVRHEDRGLVQ